MFVILVEKLLMINFINKLISSVATLFVFNKKKRHKIKKDIYETPLKSYIQRLRYNYSDYWIFQMFIPWGDMGITCSLMQEFKKIHGGKILILVKNKNMSDVAKLFPSVDKVLIIPKNVFGYIYENPNVDMKQGDYYELNHWKFIDAPYYKSKSFLDLYKNMLNIEDININLELPVFTTQIIRKVDELFDNLKFADKKIVLLCPHANSFNSLSLNNDFWLKLAKKISDLGYFVVFNSKKKVYKKYKTIFLPMAEQLYFCTKCCKIIGMRAGFNDLLAIMKLNNLIVLYPEDIYFKTISKHAQLLEFKRSFDINKNLKFEDNMYNITSLRMFNLTNVNEIICKNQNETMAKILKLMKEG